MTTPDTTETLRAALDVSPTNVPPRHTARDPRRGAKFESSRCGLKV